MGRKFLCVVAFLCFSFPAFADDFVVLADTADAVNDTVARVKEESPATQQRFADLSTMAMALVVEEMKQRGEIDEEFMDQRIKELIHNKTLDEIEFDLQEELRNHANPF